MQIYTPACGECICDTCISQEPEAEDIIYIYYVAMVTTGLTPLYTVEPPNKGHFGNGFFVLSSEVVPISEVHCILILLSSLQCLNCCG